MKSIYRRSTYGFLEIENIYCRNDADIELAAQCAKGVYAATLTIDDGKLHIIFNPEETSLHIVNHAIKIVMNNMKIILKTKVNENNNSVLSPDIISEL